VSANVLYDHSRSLVASRQPLFYPVVACSKAHWWRLKACHLPTALIATSTHLTELLAKTDLLFRV